MSGDHTPGPWKAVRDEIYPESEYRSVAMVLETPSAPANARLIAAAPELLAAASLALSIAESWIHDQLDGTSSLDSELARLAPVLAAIAKATGSPAPPSEGRG